MWNNINKIVLKDFGHGDQPKRRQTISAGVITVYKTDRFTVLLFHNSHNQMGRQFDTTAER